MVVAASITDGSRPTVPTGVIITLLTLIDRHNFIRSW